MNSPAILHYEGAPDPATDPAVAAGAYPKNLTCSAGLGGQPGVVDLKNDTLTAGPGVEPPPKVGTGGTEPSNLKSLERALGGKGAGSIMRFARLDGAPQVPHEWGR